MSHRNAGALARLPLADDAAFEELLEPVQELALRHAQVREARARAEAVLDVARMLLRTRRTTRQVEALERRLAAVRIR